MGSVSLSTTRTQKHWPLYDTSAARSLTNVLSGVTWTLATAKDGNLGEAKAEDRYATVVHHASAVLIEASYDG